jgi:hypothetical protein
MHTSKEKMKKRENENKDPVMVMNHSQQSPLTTTEDNTQTTKRFSKSSVSKKETMHKHCRRPIVDLEFLP